MYIPEGKNSGHHLALHCKKYSFWEKGVEHGALGIFVTGNVSEFSQPNEKNGGGWGLLTYGETLGEVHETSEISKYKLPKGFWTMT